MITWFMNRDFKYYLILLLGLLIATCIPLASAYAVDFVANHPKQATSIATFIMSGTSTVVYKLS